MQEDYAGKRAVPLELQRRIPYNIDMVCFLLLLRVFKDFCRRSQTRNIVFRLLFTALTLFTDINLQCFHMKQADFHQQKLIIHHRFSKWREGSNESSPRHCYFQTFIWCCRTYDNLSHSRGTSHSSLRLLTKETILTILFGEKRIINRLIFINHRFAARLDINLIELIVSKVSSSQFNDIEFNYVASLLFINR